MNIVTKRRLSIYVCLLAVTAFLALIVLSYNASPVLPSRYVPVSAAGNVYYVAKNGLDSNPGTESQPWLNVQKAMTTMTVGDTTYVKAGTYTEQVTARANGTAEARITLRAYPGDTPVLDGEGTRAKGFDFRFNGPDYSYITIDGFEIKNYTTYGICAGYGSATCNYSIIKNCIIHDNGEGIWHRGADHGLIENCTIYKNGGRGIMVYSTNYLTVKNCTIFENGNDGIFIGNNASYNTVDNCTIYNHRETGQHNDNVQLYLAYHTTVKNCRLFNEDSYTPWGTCFMAPESAVNVRYGDFYNNVVYNSGSYGITLWGSDWNIFNNTIVNNTYSALYLGYATSPVATNQIVKNNIIHGANLLSTGAGCVYDNNLVLGPTQQYYDVVCGGFIKWAAHQANGRDVNSILIANPVLANIFKDPVNHDYSLKEGSPAIGAGTNVGAPATDILGNVRSAPFDIGAYEYQAPGVIPLVAVSAPANGAVVSGLVNIGAIASDDLGVTKVEFYIDGELDSTDMVAPYQATWHTDFYTNGNHTLMAKAYDASSNIGTVTITVNVSSQIISPLTNTSVLVKYKAGTTQTAIDAVVQRLNLVVQKASDLTYRVSVPGSVSAAHFISILRNQPEVEYAEPDYTRSKSLEDDITKLTGPLSISNGETPSLEAASALEDILTSGLTTGTGNLTSQSLSLSSSANQEPLKAVSRDIGIVAVSGLYTVLALFAVAIAAFIKQILFF